MTTNLFFERPILNSPYAYPSRHWELDSTGQPTQRIVEHRRAVELITPIPRPRKQKGPVKQQQLVFDEGKGLSSERQLYDPTPIINTLRRHVDLWRALPDPSDWRVTPETARLLQHWRHHAFNTFRPFFCQLEAIETLIWLTEVAPESGKAGATFLEHLANANNDANPDLPRLALKLATGAGKTTVMAMLIAWQTVNAARRHQSKKFTTGFLIVAPGLTVKERLRVLQPNDPDSYYQSRELVPADLLADLGKAKIVITNSEVYQIEADFEARVGAQLDAAIEASRERQLSGSSGSGRTALWGSGPWGWSSARVGRGRSRRSPAAGRPAALCVGSAECRAPRLFVLRVGRRFWPGTCLGPASAVCRA